MALQGGERKKYAVCGLAALIIFLLDQAAKWLVVNYLPSGGAIEILPGFFDLVNIRNRGAAFGFLNRPDIQWQFWLFLAATALAIWAIFSLLRSSRYQLSLALGLGFILGGALGNLLDRLRHRAVVDFLDFYWGGWHWPAFNVADIGICAGAGLTCLAFLRQKPGRKA